MNESEILARLYGDKMTVYRKDVVVNEETLESEFKEFCVYTGIPCGLSQSDNSAPTETTITSNLENEMILFTTPGILLQANDKVVVVTSEDAVFEGITSKTFPYKSHGETTFKIHKIV